MHEYNFSSHYMFIKLKSKAQKLLFIDIEEGNISMNS